MAIPGDTLELINKQIYIDGEAVENPPNMQTSFKVETPRGVHKNTMQELNITDFSNKDNLGGAMGGRFYMNTTIEQADQLRKVKGVDVVEEIFYDKGGRDVAFPEAQRYQASQYTAYRPKTEFGWTIDNFGPLVMPEEGMTIPLTQKNIDLYRTVIQHYEENDNVVIDGTTVSIDGEVITEYTFKQGYYYMIGDNRHNSEDSRTWGFVPANHIVGKPLFVFWSVDRTDPNAGFFSRIRFDRIFDLIK
jgi:signal peptidase I